jgi:DNA primase
MGLFPQAFLDDLRAQADIVQVVQEHVPLKRAGANYRGLCPFHSEKTPSFSVNRERAFFHCFGCGAGGDVFKFLELRDQIGFQDAVRLLAQRFGVPVPEPEEGRRSAETDAEREALLKMHEVAAAYFREQLDAPGGGAARQLVRQRLLSDAICGKLGIGYAPPAREGLKARLVKQGFALPLMIRSGLVVERERGEVIDRFRNRLMIPICRESGTIIAFGGRAMGPDQLPKYLNSPETPIYTKGRTFFGLHLTKAEVKRLGYAVIVEGYFDVAQALQAGITPIVASSGTALTLAQAQLLRRFANKVILSFDPDAAGQGAAARSCELLVSEGFQVNVALLPQGQDPDTFIRRQGGQAYAERLRTSQPYLEYLLDRVAADYDLANDESRRLFLGRMLTVAAWIPDAAARDQFADRLAHKARILEEVVRAEIRKAAVARRTTLPAAAATALVGALKPAEKGLIWALMRTPETAIRAMDELEEDDVGGLVTASILQTAISMRSWPPTGLPEALLERLNSRETNVAEAVASESAAPAPPEACVKALKRLRFERERTAVQREIDRLQELGAARHDHQIDALFARKIDLLHRIEALT